MRIGPRDVAPVEIPGRGFEARSESVLRASPFASRLERTRTRNDLDARPASACPGSGSPRDLVRGLAATLRFHGVDAVRRARVRPRARGSARRVFDRRRDPARRLSGGFSSVPRRARQHPHLRGCHASQRVPRLGSSTESASASSRIRRVGMKKCPLPGRCIGRLRRPVPYSGRNPRKPSERACSIDPSPTS